MPNYRVLDPEDVVECPYEKAHMIRVKRLPYHLIKCRKNYVGTDFAVCPFNARHEMPRPELKYHTATCPDKHLIEGDIAYAQRRNDPDSGTYFKGNTSVPSYDIEWNRPEPTEDWDAEVAPVVRVGIDEKVLNEPSAYRSMTGLRPSEKKEYKKRLVQIEQRKMQNLPYEDLLVDMTGSRAAQAKRDEEERKAMEEAAQQSQLRVPKEKPRVVQQQEVLQNKLLMSAGIGRGRPAVAPQAAPATNGRYPNPAEKQQINQNTMLLAQLARGRGTALGRGQPQPMPTVGSGRGFTKYQLDFPPVGANQVPPSQAGAHPPGRVGCNGEESVSSSSSNSGDGETSKNQSRKLQKKLREIDVLLRRQKLGGTLDTAQLSKVSKRDEILDELEQLELEAE